MSNLAKFYQDSEWHLVENVIKDCFKELAKEPDESLAPADFKAQILANKKMLEGIQEFLGQAKLLTHVNLKSNNPFE